MDMDQQTSDGVSVSNSSQEPLKDAARRKAMQRLIRSVGYAAPTTLVALSVRAGISSNPP